MAFSSTSASRSSQAQMNVSDYANDVLLDVPFQPQVDSLRSGQAKDASASYPSVLLAVTKYFLSEYRRVQKAHKQHHNHSHAGEEVEDDGDDSDDAAHHRHHEDDEEGEEKEDSVDSMASSERRRMLHSLLCIRSPAPIPDSVQQQLDALLQYEQRKEEHTNVASIPSISQLFSTGGALKDVSNRLSLWRGDITSLAADCIVNAANRALLGCFQPSHTCIDNIIHAVAGPRLRLDCDKIMRKQGTEEADGRCKVTRAYHLPARYVLHTVGPQIESGRTQETESERQQLASCYRECLNAAAQLKNVHSVAFCCISTGLFGFPAVAAANIAVQTVSAWLRQQTDKQVSKIDRVIFNVFTESDEKIYTEIFRNGVTAHSLSVSVSGSSSLTASTLSSRSAANLSTAAEWLASADAVLIAGAAGLSASCGLDYTSETVFKRLFPAMHRRGFRCMYEFIGFKDWTPELKWGYVLSQVNLARYNWRTQDDCEIYRTLLKVFQHFGDSSFVLTSNADGLFGQTGFDLERVYTAQGDYGMMQCLKQCAADSLWPTKPFIDAALPYVDKDTQLITNAAVIPKCKRCGGEVFLNVRGGSWFIEQHFMPKRAKYLGWLNSMIKEKKRIVILEIGVGFNTAGVIRYPMESLAENHDNVRLIRINQHQPQVPKHLSGQRALSIDVDATQAIRVIAQPILQRIEKVEQQGVALAKAVQAAKMDVDELGKIAEPR